jgi:hypothetical protein
MEKPMKLFSLNSHVDAQVIVAAMHHGIGATPYYVPDAYPTPRIGIELTEDRCVAVGTTKIPVDAKLLDCTDPAVIKRERNRVILLQASIGKVDGVSTVVAPKEGEDRTALVKMDLSGFPHLHIRYQPADEQLIARVGVDDGYPDERMLAKIEIGKPLRAQRFDQKFVFFGEERVRERLTIRFDGRTIAYDNYQIDAPGFWRSLFG